MRTRNSRNLTAIEQSKLARRTPLKINTYRGGTLTDQQRKIIDSFTKKDYDTWCYYYRRWSKAGRTVLSLYTALTAARIVGPCLELAQIRVDDVYTAQKMIACLRARWTDITRHKIDQLNNNQAAFWNKMASGIQHRVSNGHGVRLASQWQGREGKARLAEYLSELYEKQTGLCALSGQAMELAVTSRHLGNDSHLTNKASPDRIDSSRGYVPGNIQLTTWWVNQCKIDLTMEEFRNKVLLLADNIR